uniref:DNA polymerase III subunit delta n=1 Tax=uncultured Planctomycetota bacterium TaxID=120965 RepID=H5SBZ5_9BACT|nr:DNA polymerase III subunit delta [uncultured Planctomycetota bacterium]
MDALQFLAENKPLRTVRALYVLAGPDRFLKRLVLERLLARLAPEQGQEWSRSDYAGDSEHLAEVLTEVQTPALWGGRRLVVVDDADQFVSRYRETLEKLAGQHLAAVLILLVEKWASNTRLAKALPQDALILCETPKARQLVSWCQNRTASEYGKKLATEAAELLVELTGSDLGLLEQELAKLAVYVGEGQSITSEDVDKLVARNRMQTVWQILEALGRGQLSEALVILGRLLEQGEEPLAILGALSWQLRKVAQVAGLISQGLSEAQAVGRVGVQAWQRDRLLVLVRQLRERALRIYDWLVQTDLQIKSTHLPPRSALETLLVRLLPAASPGSASAPTARL